VFIKEILSPKRADLSPAVKENKGLLRFLVLWGESKDVVLDGNVKVLVRKHERKRV